MLVCQWIGLASLWVLDNHVAINMGIARIEHSYGFLDGAHTMAR